MSQYVANLNTIPSAQDMASRNQDPLEIENDLALFTNTEFFDFDLSEVPDLTEPVDYDPAMEERARRQNASAYNRHLNSSNANTNNNSSKSVDFMDGMFACFLVSVTSFIFRNSVFHCHVRITPILASRVARRLCANPANMAFIAPPHSPRSSIIRP